MTLINWSTDVSFNLDQLQILDPIHFLHEEHLIYNRMFFENPNDCYQTNPICKNSGLIISSASLVMIISSDFAPAFSIEYAA